MLLRVFVLFLLIVFTGQAYTQPIVLNENQSVYLVGPNAFFYKDTLRNKTFEEISSSDFAVNFKPSTQKTMGFGFTNAIVWVRFDVKNEYPALSEWLLEISNPVLDNIEFFYLNNYEDWESKKFGDLMPFEKREILHRNFVIPLHHPDLRIRTYYLKFDTRTAVQLPMTIHNTREFYEREIESEIAHGFFYGMMIVMIVYNLFVFFALRDVNYLFYVLNILSSTLYFAARSGHAFQYLWANNVWVGDHFILLTIGAWASSSALFTKKFLSTKNYVPFLSRILDLVILLGLVEILMTIFVSYTLTSKFGTYLILFNNVLLMLTSVVCWRRGNQSARFFMIAWFFYMIGTILLAMKTFGWLPSNIYTDYSSEVGAALEVVLLALALSDKYSLMRKEKEKAQAEALENERKANEIQRKANEELEQKVVERTAAINQQKEEIEAQKEKLEDQNHEIHKQKEQIESSIKYAQRIQESMLPDNNDIRDVLPYHFILFMPRDIVSGDFYWFGKSEMNHLILIAAVDCTGHGVPGSFMSMLGNNILNEIVTSRHVTSVELVLEYLHIGVRRTLRQEDTNNRDGMDIALCAIDLIEKRIDFAGAKNPLVYIQNNELNMIKGDKMPIGGKQEEDRRIFTKHSLSYQNNPICFYIFTDGYEDQFGGSEGRKFMSKRLKELFLNIHQKDMPTQKTILKDTFTVWKGLQKQIDDVLIIGLHLE